MIVLLLFWLVVCGSDFRCWVAAIGLCLVVVWRCVCFGGFNVFYLVVFLICLVCV